MELGAIIILILLGFYTGTHMGYEVGYNYVVGYYNHYVNEVGQLPLRNCTCFCGGGWGDSRPYYTGGFDIPLELEFNISE